MAKKFGDKQVRFFDPKTGRRQIDFSNYTLNFKNGGVTKKARVSLSSFGKGSTRSQHFSHADKAMTTALGKKFNRSGPQANASYTTPTTGTWHHHPTQKVMDFVPTEIHKAIGHEGGIKALF